MIRLFVYLLLFVTVFVSVCMHTKPDREMHLHEISSSLMANINAVVPEGVVIPEETIEKLNADSVVTTMLDKMFVVDDYVAFTVGRVVAGDNKYVISVGFFDKVFALSQEGITEKVVYKLREKGIVD